MEAGLVKNTRFEVLTPGGWSHFDGIKVVKKTSRKITFDDGSQLITSNNHLLKTKNGFIEAKNLIKNDRIFPSKFVVNNLALDDEEELYDLINVEKDHEYYTEGVVSHNCAWIEDFDEIWTGLSPTISTGGSAILLSTPNGVGGQYYKIWTDAVSGANNFNGIQLPWHVHPEHDEEWFKNETRGLSRRQISQEFECDFISSGETFLQPETMEHLKAKISMPPERGTDRNLWIWKKPIFEHKYIISADVSRGDSGDFSAFHVIDTSSSEVVAEYKGKIPPDKLADLLFDTGMEYNKALLCPENNTFGYTTCTKLKDKAYPRLFYMSCKGDPFSYIPTDNEELPGFSTQQKSRVQILSHLEQVLRNGMLQVNSQRLYNELQSFIWKGAKAVASKDSHDDLVMSLAIGAWIAVDNTSMSQSAIDLANAMLKASGIIKNDISNITAGINSVRPVGHSINPNNQAMLRKEYSRPQDPGRFGQNDFSWLLK